MFNHQTHTNKMKKKIILFFLLISLIITNSCNSPTEPEPIYKDPLTMTWTVDTLEYPDAFQTTLSSIWGSSPNDVYAVGHSEDNDGKFWHYNGVKWEFKDLFQFVEQSSWSLHKVYGFGPNDFWVIGARDRSIAGYEYMESLVLQNNGLWIDHKLKFDSWLMDITGTSSRDIWVCGRKGIVLHYNGYVWKANTIKIKKFSEDTDYVLAGVTKLGDENVIVARTYNPYLPRREQYYIRGSMDNWRIIDSTIFTAENWGAGERWGNLGIFRSNSGTIYSYGYGGVWILNSTTNQWISTLKKNNAIRRVFGLKDRYIFAVSDFGLVWFNNGNTWVELKNLMKDQEKIDFYGIWTDGHEIYLMGDNNKSTYVIHGK